jgi:hypothetical protein
MAGDGFGHELRRDILRIRLEPLAAKAKIVFPQGVDLIQGVVRAALPMRSLEWECRSPIASRPEVQERKGPAAVSGMTSLFVPDDPPRAELA